MAVSDFWAVNGVNMPCPSTWSFGLMDVSAAESGRTDDAKMHKNRVAQKRKISVGYNGVTDAIVHTVLTAINPEYINVTYHDPLVGGKTTKTFYVGDRTAPVKWWFTNKHVYESLTFDLIER